MERQAMRQSLRRGLTTNGPTSWISATTQAVKDSNELVRQASRTIGKLKRTDPLPGLRDTLAGLSNDLARTQFRQLRIVTHMLRDKHIDVNTEIRSLLRSQEALEKCRASLDKDLHVNSISMDARQNRPGQEKAQDTTDSLLKAERQHLTSLKRSVECELRLMEQQLRGLDVTRGRLATVGQERGRALDLVSHTLPRGSCRPNLDSLEASEASAFVIDPLGPYTSDVDAALDEAKLGIQGGKALRKKAAQVILMVGEVQGAATKAVNALLTRKISETACLTEQLSQAMRANRKATNKAQRFFDATEHNWLQCNGPVSSDDLTTRERLDRPLIKVLQRHPGTNLPEAQRLVQGSGALLDTLQYAGSTVGRLKLAHQRLEQDERCKRDAMNVDGSLVLMRRRKVL